jgi:hypothetical protein
MRELMRELSRNVRIGNAETRRSQNFTALLSSALSASLRFNLPPSAKLEQAIKANLRGLGYGG